METSRSAAPPSPPLPPTPVEPPRVRPLRRLPRQGHVGGVCAGLAEYFVVDPIIVRIAAVILAISGPGIPAYVLAWIFVPKAEGASAPTAGPEQGRADRGAQAFGIVLLVVAASTLLGGWWSPARQWLFPLGLIALGTWLLLRRTDRSADAAREEADLAGRSDPTPPAAPDVPGSPDGAPPGPPLPPDVHDLGPGDQPPGGPGPDAAVTGRRRRQMVLPGVLGGLLVWTGVAVVLGISLQTGLAIALCIVGLGLVLGAFVGGGTALIVPAVVLSVALLLSSVIHLPMSGPIGERTWVPASVDQLRRYELSIGEATVDLTELSVPDGERVEVRASVGIGHLVVIVPDDVAVEVSGEASLGEVSVFGRTDAGWGPSTSRSFDLERFDEVLALHLEVGIGQVEVVAESGRRATERLR